MTALPHDDDRAERIFVACRSECVRFAARLLSSSGSRNRYLAIVDAEEFYDTAWETYYRRKEYLHEGEDHLARINVLIVSRVRDEWRRSLTEKRRVPGELVDMAQAEEPVPAGRPGTRRAPFGTNAAPGPAEQVVDRDELRALLARVDNPADARALFDHEIGGLTYEEIGRNEGITAEAARRRAQRARRQAADRPAAGKDEEPAP